LVIAELKVCEVSYFDETWNERCEGKGLQNCRVDYEFCMNYANLGKRCPQNSGDISAMRL